MFEDRVGARDGVQDWNDRKRRELRVPRTDYYCSHTPTVCHGYVSWTRTVPAEGGLRDGYSVSSRGYRPDNRPPCPVYTRCGGTHTTQERTPPPEGLCYDSRDHVSSSWDQDGELLQGTPGLHTGCLSCLYVKDAVDVRNPLHCH